MKRVLSNRLSEARLEVVDSFTSLDKRRIPVVDPEWIKKVSYRDVSSIAFILARNPLALDVEKEVSEQLRNLELTSGHAKLDFNCFAHFLRERLPSEIFEALALYRV